MFFKLLFAKLFRERTAAEREASEQFADSVKEAFLHQGNLRDAVDQLRKVREECESNRPSPVSPTRPLYRRTFGSTPS